MDPVTILTLTGTSAKIIETCASAIWNLRDIRQRWKNAPKLLDSIVRECETIADTIRLMTDSLVPLSKESFDDEDFLRGLLSALQNPLEVLQGLEQSTAEFRKSKNDSWRWRRLKLLVNESSLRGSRDELRWQAQATQNLWCTFKLAAPDRRTKIQEIQTRQKVHSSQTSVDSSSRASILSADEPEDGKNSLTDFAGASQVFGRVGNIFDAEKNTRKVAFIPQSLKKSSSRSRLLMLYFGLALLVAFLGLILSGAFTSIIEMYISTSTPATPFLGEALLAAAAAGSWEKTSKLLKEGAKPSIRDSNLQTPLHLAAANGSASTIKLLLEHKDTGWFANDYITPLHLAARHGHIAAVKQIAEISGHDWSSERAKDLGAIRKIKASMGNRFDQRFASFFKEKKFTARELAIIYGHVDTALSFPSRRNDDIRHALSCACMLGDVHMVEEIWNHHKDRGYFQRHSSLESRVRWFPAPPLHLAVMSGNRPTVAFLLERGWKANSQSSRSIFGWFTDASLRYSSPAHYAAIVGSKELLNDLRRRGANADLTALDHLSRTPLSYAVENLDESAVELLVERKHPKRGPLFGWCYPFFGKCISQSYLGSGHVWQDRKLEVAAIPSKSIKEALKGVGFSV